MTHCADISAPLRPRDEEFRFLYERSCATTLHEMPLSEKVREYHFRHKEIAASWRPLDEDSEIWFHDLRDGARRMDLDYPGYLEAHL